MKLAVVIPTYKYHIPLLKATLESIVAQTCFPDLVIVHASSCDTECRGILAGLRNAQWPFPLLILETEKAQHTAQNKNDGAAAVPEEIDVISFFDSDDLMHPRRIEFVKQYISEGYDVVYHGFMYSSEWNIMEEPKPILDCYIKQETVAAAFSGKHFTIRRLIFLDEEDNAITYSDGNVTLRKHCFERIKYNTEARGHQDAVFASELHQARYKLVHLSIPLMMYTRVSEEEFIKKAM